jgi:hypothetical protein
MKTYQVVQKLLVGGTQTGDLISLLSFLVSRLKRSFIAVNPGTAQFSEEMIRF